MEKKIGERARLSLVRVKKKIPVAELAKRVACSRKTIYALLWGTRRPSLDLAIAIERETGIKAKRWTV